MAVWVSQQSPDVATEAEGPVVRLRAGVQFYRSTCDSEGRGHVSCNGMLGGSCEARDARERRVGCMDRHGGRCRHTSHPNRKVGLTRSPE